MKTYENGKKSVNVSKKLQANQDKKPPTFNGTLTKRKSSQNNIDPTFPSKYNYKLRHNGTFKKMWRWSL
jgi:hypothetical protein